MIKNYSLFHIFVIEYNCTKKYKIRHNKKVGEKQNDDR